MKINHRKRESAQILVVVLLVLSIMAIFIMSVAVSARRDVFERVTNEKYEQYYSLSENRLLQLVQDSKITSNISFLTTKYPYVAGSGCRAIGVTYNCDFSDSAQTGSVDTLGTNVIIFDTATISDLPITKDSTFLVALVPGLNQPQITMSWTGAKVAWEISLDIRNSTTGEYFVLKDIYDGAGVLTPGPQTHIFGFVGATANSVTFNLNAYTGRAANYLMQDFRIKPIIKSGEQSTQLSMVGQTLPQVRQFTAKGVSSVASQTGNTSPTVILQVQLPLNPAPVAILDYVLRSETDVRKP